MTTLRPAFTPKHLKRKNVDGKRMYEVPDSNGQTVYLTSITTMLGWFSAPSIAKWKRSVGKQESDRISKEASSNGNSFHLCCENYLSKERDYKEYIQTEEDQDQFDSIRSYLDSIDEVLYQEVPLYSLRLGIAGTVDCIGVVDGKLTIIDFKTSRKHKKKDWIQNYLLQATFYSMALYELSGMEAKDINIPIAVGKGNDFQLFTDKVGNYMGSLLHHIKEYNAAHELPTYEKEKTVA